MKRFKIKIIIFNICKKTKILYFQLLKIYFLLFLIKNKFIKFVKCKYNKKLISIYNLNFYLRFISFNYEYYDYNLISLYFNFNVILHFYLKVNFHFNLCFSLTLQFIKNYWKLKIHH